MDNYIINDWARIGLVVRDVRRARKVTQRDLAEAAGVSRGWLIRLEAGHPNPEAASLMPVLRALDLELVVRPTARSTQDVEDESALEEMLRGD
ncbi:helix-turn-helix domain-containing protein [Nocardioides humilatus]|uniref:helix-turn-helix domain-containing protein n=1 Tax=Nocardioides humilatus TaxID=2607660 RepID=UPI00165F3C3B|nr:helix-turn-helix domain-containing protein [Nocardioides humilatus]